MHTKHEMNILNSLVKNKTILHSFYFLFVTAQCINFTLYIVHHAFHSYTVFILQFLFNHSQVGSLPAYSLFSVLSSSTLPAHSHSLLFPSLSLIIRWHILHIFAS
eukprot:883827_1